MRFISFLIKNFPRWTHPGKKGASAQKVNLPDHRMKENTLIMLSEKKMEDLVAENPSRFVGEDGLRLIARQYRIGSYIFDLLFEDRHRGKLIVELQIGTLDRDHTYRILDYYDEFRERFPTEFTDVMVIANRVPPERQRRLRDRGIRFREIPEGEFLAALESMTDHHDAADLTVADVTNAVKPSSTEKPTSAEMTTAIPAESPSRDAVGRAVARIREEYLDDPCFHSVRRQAEGKAKEMLDTILGRMSPEDIELFLKYLNAEYIKGRRGPSRFGRHFTNILAPYVCGCPHEFNEWIGMLWRTKEDGLQEVLENFLTTAPIKGAGTLLPTFVLYLRTPAAFTIWTKTLEANLAKAFTGGQPPGRSQHERYAHFNRQVIDLLVTPFRLEPHEVDLVLSKLPKYFP